MYYHTRAQFTEVDYEFISQTLGTTAEERRSILRRTEDPFTVTELLHDPRLFERSLTTPPMFLSISPQLFFYVFVYRALDHRHLPDDDVADYVAGICVEFRSSQPLFHLAGTEGGKTVYMVDLLKMLPDLGKAQQYFLRRYIGNVSLFLTGFFPDFIFRRSKDIGAPPLAYYERVGRAQYETAAEDSALYDSEAAPVLNTLAEHFIAVRSAMNVFTDAYLDLHNDKYALNRIQRQAATLDEESFRGSLDP
jgi:hypothetical protein